MSTVFLRRFHVTAARRLIGNPVYIVSSARTPVGKIFGVLKSQTAADLGVVAVKAAIERTQGSIKPTDIEELYFGNVLQAGTGQSPARQVVIKSGLPEEVEATTINKVCASGLKSVALASQSIQLGDRDIIIAGGMESMSNTPYAIKRAHGPSFGHQQVQDLIIHDGLTDVYNQIHMGNCCENTVKRDGITREDQDNFAIESYKRAIAAQESGAFKNEIAPVIIKSRKGEVTVTEDEEPKTVNFDKLKTLRPAFEKNGSVTAGNSSALNDGASALILASGAKAKELGAPIQAKILAYADAAIAPIDFTIAPSFAIPKLFEKVSKTLHLNITPDQISKWELNEAFSGVALANLKRLKLDPSKVNINGGAVALGHPLGSSGARILVTLINVLKEGEYGVASLCNGGGAATAILIQKVSSVQE